MAEDRDSAHYPSVLGALWSLIRAVDPRKLNAAAYTQYQLSHAACILGFPQATQRKVIEIGAHLAKSYGQEAPLTYSEAIKQFGTSLLDIAEKEMGSDLFYGLQPESAPVSE